MMLSKVLPDKARERAGAGRATGAGAVARAALLGVLALALWGCGPADIERGSDAWRGSAAASATSDARQEAAQAEREASGTTSATDTATGTGTTTGTGLDDAMGGAETATDAATGTGAEADPTVISVSVSDVAFDLSDLEFYDPSGDYTLQQVVVLSRHNIRAPLSTNGSALDQASSYDWIDWTANGSELTSRGGALETMTGQYFRAWLEHEGLFPQNYQPEEGAVRFYANARQRTMATAQYFSSGLLPVANAEIETHADYDTMDPVFNPQVTYLSDAYEQAALAQIAQTYGQGSMAGVAAGLEESFDLIADVVGYAGSVGYANGTYAALDTADTQVSLAVGEEPSLSGSLKLACQLSDALVLQYYEAPDDQAAFGAQLSEEQWRLVSQAKDTYGEVLFGAPLVAVNVAHPLLAEIGSEMDAEGRRFSFLCGHDSNIVSVLAALGVEDYELPLAIEADTPIGCKLVFERWADANGEQYGRVRLVYQGVDQLRRGSMLSGYEAPESVELHFAGLATNADGLCRYEDLRALVAQATDAYDALPETYGAGDEEVLAAADANKDEEAEVLAEAA